MRKIIINKTKTETQIAILEEDKLVEFHVDNDEELITGNIYSGVIKNKLKNMEAFFIDIGKEKNGYLHVTDDRVKKMKAKENILVQVKKDETDEKGAYLTLDISLNGKYMVLLPTNKEKMFSKKITIKEDKEKLLELNNQFNKNECGIIFRNEMLTATFEKIQSEYNILFERWNEIYHDYQYRKAPVLLYKQGLAENIYSNMVNKETEKIVVNDETIYEELMQFGFDSQVEFYEDHRLDVFDFYKVESQLEKALSDKVWLKSGGELRIDKTEAMTIIDIDTSKFSGKSNMEETAFKTNSEAAVEIARQIRLRNISGIIIVDFINMKNEGNKREIVKILKDETAKDNMKTMVIGMTKLGLIEMTRQKGKKSLDDIYKQDCPVCRGKGKIASANAIVTKIERELTYLEKETIYDKVTIEAHELVVKKLMSSQVIKSTKLKTLLKANKGIKVDEYKITKNSSENNA